MRAPAAMHEDDIPMNWVCLECSARKEDVEMVEVD